MNLNQHLLIYPIIEDINKIYYSWPNNLKIKMKENLDKNYLVNIKKNTWIKRWTKQA